MDKYLFDDSFESVNKNDIFLLKNNEKISYYVEDDIIEGFKFVKKDDYNSEADKFLQIIKKIFNDLEFTNQKDKIWGPRSNLILSYSGLLTKQNKIYGLIKNTFLGKELIIEIYKNVSYYSYIKFKEFVNKYHTEPYYKNKNIPYFLKKYLPFKDSNILFCVLNKIRIIFLKNWKRFEDKNISSYDLLNYFDKSFTKCRILSGMDFYKSFFEHKRHFARSCFDSWSEEDKIGILEKEDYVCLNFIYSSTSFELEKNDNFLPSHINPFEIEEIISN